MCGNMVSSDTFKLPDSSLNDNLPSFYSNYSAVSIFISVTAVLGLPLKASSTTLLFLFLKCLHHQNTIVWLIASVPYVFCNISNISSPLFPGFTQNCITHLFPEICELSFCFHHCKTGFLQDLVQYTYAIENNGLFH
jgi:hypothetical protein